MCSTMAATAGTQTNNAAAPAGTAPEGGAGPKLRDANAPNLAAAAGQLASHVVRAGGHILFWTCITCTAQAATFWGAAILSKPLKKAIKLSRQ